MTWTAQPANPTKARQGKDVSLTWNSYLTADELTESQLFFKVSWKKFNPLSSSFVEIASFVIITGGSPSHFEPNAPHIVIDRASGVNSSTLQIKGVTTDDEGSYKIEISFVFPGTDIAAYQEVNLTVLGEYKLVLKYCHGSGSQINCFR